MVVHARWVEPNLLPTYSWVMTAAPEPSQPSNSRSATPGTVSSKAGTSSTLDIIVKVVIALVLMTPLYALFWVVFRVAGLPNATIGIMLGCIILFAFVFLTWLQMKARG